VVFEEVSCPYELDRLPCYEDNNGWPAGIPEFCAANTEGGTNAPTTTTQPTLRPTTHPLTSQSPNQFQHPHLPLLLVENFVVPMTSSTADQKQIIAASQSLTAITVTRTG